MWSAGCMIAELFLGRPIFIAQTELALLTQIFRVCGRPNYKAKCKGGYEALIENAIDSAREDGQPLPTETKLKQRIGELVNEADKTLFPFSKLMTEDLKDLILQLLNLDPQRRLTAAQALQHPYFTSCQPAPCSPSEFPEIE